MRPDMMSKACTECVGERGRLAWGCQSAESQVSGRSAFGWLRAGRQRADCWLFGNPSVGKGAVVMTNGAMGKVLAMEIISAIIWEYGWPDGHAEGQG
jgi:hypothetical protein